MPQLSKICTKRLMGDVKMLMKEPLEYIEAVPDDKDMLTWYFLIKGPEFSDYNGGYYIGKIMHDPDYPFKPPNFMMLTPSGRFIPDNKICLSNSGYHKDEWSAMWNIKTILAGFLSIMLDDVEHGISHIRGTPEGRAEMAKNSIECNRSKYPDIVKRFTRLLDENGDPKSCESSNEAVTEESKKLGKKESKAKSKKVVKKKVAAKSKGKTKIKSKVVAKTKEKVVTKH